MEIEIEAQVQSHKGARQTGQKRLCPHVTLRQQPKGGLLSGPRSKSSRLCPHESSHLIELESITAVFKALTRV
jgi:hypothetical protein